MRRNHNGYRVGQDHQHAKVDDATVAAMRAAYVPYVFGIKAVSVRFGVPWSTTRDIVKYWTRPV